MHKKRLLIVYFLFLTSMLLVSVRIYIIATDGSSAQKVLSGQYSRKLEIAERSGFVFDRNGKLCGIAEDGYSVYADPAKIPYDSYETYAQALSDASGKETSYYFEKLHLSVPFVTFSDEKCELYGIQNYKLYKTEGSNFLCHILGYCNSDGKGVSGLRKAYDTFLHDDGKKYVVARYTANALGGEAPNTTAVIEDNGYNEKHGVYLTIDAELQKKTEDICEKMLEKGCVIVQDINTGEILSCLSKPTYNTDDVTPYLTSENGELLNRVFLGYTPGSVFKTVVASAMLEEDISLIDREYECKGYIEVSGKKISCHKKDGHGKIKMREAFSVSCNPYFISLALENGIASVIKTAKEMGVSEFSKIDELPVSGGVLPYEKTENPIDIANTAVGQGKLLLTPLEMNTIMMCAVTGSIKTPHIVEKLVSDNTEEFVGMSDKKQILNPQTVAALRSMLESCVNNGTGYRIVNDTVSCGGKTATAQSGQIKNGKEVIHSWFSGYFPADEPSCVVTVLCDGNSEKNEHPTLIFKEIALAAAK